MPAERITGLSIQEVLAVDDSLPMDPRAHQYWVKDLRNPLRKFWLPVLRVLMSLVLHTTYVLKRAIPLQFSAHRLLQSVICWYMKWFVTPEANYLILHHFGAEANILNFLIANSARRDTPPATLYPSLIRDLLPTVFVDHDRELFHAIVNLGSTTEEAWPVAREALDFSLMRPVEVAYDPSYRKWTQFLDFETAHELFKTTFCFLLTADEYEAAINGFQLDQSIAVRIAKIVDDPTLMELAYNKYPLALHGTINLSRRFVMHGIFVEHLHAYLENLMREVGQGYAAAGTSASRSGAARSMPGRM